MTRRSGLLSLFGLICASCVALLPSPAHAAQGDLQLIGQTFNIAADGSLTVTIALPASLTNTDLSTTLIAVTVEQRVNKREDLAPIVNRTLSRRDDTVAFSPSCCVGPQPGQLTFSIPLELSEVRPDALSIPRAGLYPVTIALQREGRILSTVLTFINRLPAPDESGGDPDSISVALAIGTHSAVHVDSKGVTGLDDQSTIAEMTALADTLDALTANKFPSTVRIAPEVLNGLQALDLGLFTRLVASLQLHQVSAEPQWPIDPSTAAAAGQGSLYTSWLRDGQDRLVGLGLGPAIISRSTIFVDQPISAEGLTLRRNLGAGLMVMTPQLYDDLVPHGAIGLYSDYTGALFAAELPNDTAFDVAVVDHSISNLLVHPLATPELTRIYAVADMLALRQKLEIDGANLRRHAVLIATPDLGVPDASLIGAITALVGQTPGLTAATLDDLAVRTDRYLNDGAEQPVTLPQIDGVEVQKRISMQANLNSEIDAVASMLPGDSDRPNGWRDLADLLPTTALDDLNAELMDVTVRAELTEIRNAIEVPPAYSVNLSGRESTVRVRFVNTSDVPLLIKVQLSSPPGKLVFANDPQPVLLAPGVPTNIPIGVRALSNGTSGVSLDVFTPNDSRLADTVPMEFQVNALGVGNVLTIALFGLVVVWWLQNARSTRRKRRQLRAATLPDS
ncbi:MAG: DUF6049 family protein [Ilumatobacteraceae bacterium]